MMNQAEITSQELASIAKARASFNSFLNVHFVSLPDAKFVKQMRQPEITSMLKALVKDESVDEDLAYGASLMLNFIEGTRSNKTAQMVEKLGVDRTRLYRGVAPTYGPPPPYEMVWSKTFQDLGLMQILAGTYRENGLEPSPEARDRWDYIGMELQFLVELALREAAAWEKDDGKAARSLLGKQHEFFSQHMEQWIPDFVQKALEFVETDFYKGHLLMLNGFIKDEKQEYVSLVEHLNI